MYDGGNYISVHGETAGEAHPAGDDVRPLQVRDVEAVNHPRRAIQLEEPSELH